MHGTIGKRGGRCLSFEQAVEVWLRVWRKEIQDRIAASYDVNPGRVSEVVNRHKHLGSEAVAMARRDNEIN